MGRLFKNKFSKKKPVVSIKEPVVSIGEIKRKSITSKKSVSKDNKRFKVVKLNGKTQYYVYEFGKETLYNRLYKKTLYMSELGKKLVKSYPEFVNFLKEVLYDTNSSFSFENNKLKFRLNKFIPVQGNVYDRIFKMNVLFKDKNIKKKYFVKISYNNHASSNSEFLASQFFEKLGINIIKPHISFIDDIRNRNIIVYDFTNMVTLREALSENIITDKQLLDIKQKIMKINDIEGIRIGTHSKRGVMDYMNLGNIFIEKDKTKINIYFKDLFIGNGVQLWEQ
jgi:hypothetical protein